MENTDLSHGPCADALIAPPPLTLEPMAPSMGNSSKERRLSANADIHLPVQDGESFAAYFGQVLVPELERGTVIILDNLATQKNAAVAKTLRNVGCWFLFLPRYSPDPNSIEMAFSKLKAQLRRIDVRTFIDMFDALTEICNLFSSEECWNCFIAAGHVQD
ncbi:transposase [Ruegeria sp. 2205SS24-7]|uniref:transposase n=1 Tax=Ruegeria discodermiae TaxID=3064389 RepID=UPI0027403BCB|nr:transposase [Ruegeria sp. 2205SS24-7]MDP5220571.1 transposase [Ruegeria sp. 2205SS24-7]